MAKKKSPQKTSAANKNTKQSGFITTFWNRLSTARKWALAILGVLAGLATILAVFPETPRNNILYDLALIAPSSTPTSTSTASSTPTPTATPTNTATSTATFTPTNTSSPTPEFAPAREGEVLVIVAEFDKQGGQTVESQTMAEQLSIGIDAAASDPQLQGLPVKVVRTAEVVTSREAAKTLAERNNATIVIWGSVANSILTTHYEITPRWGHFVDTSIEQTDFRGQLSTTASLIDQVTYQFENAVDQSYVTNFTLAQLLYSGERYDTALPLFEQLLAQIEDKPVRTQVDRGLADAWYYVGFIYGFIRNDFVKAEQAYSEAILLNPSFAEAYSNRGNARAEQNKLDDAITDYTKSIELNNPELWIPYSNRGNAYTEQGKLDDAIADYDKAIALNPQYAKAYNNRGSVLGGQGKLNEALDNFTKAIALSPHYAEAHYNRGLTFHNLDKLDDAIADYDKAIALNPQYTKAYNNRGYTFYKQGKFDEAIADYTTAIDLNPQHAGAYNNRGIALRDQGKLNEAIADFTKAIEIDPLFASAYWNLGASYYNQKRDFEALQSYRRYLELAGDNANPDVLQRVLELEALLGTPTPAP